MNQSSHTRSPEVSVLMSCHNASRWLPEAIDSVLAQTFDDYEFILVDDGSTDETWNIIQSYCDRDDRFVAISKKTTGLQDSLNVGIAKARGAWIARLDADDLCEPTRLEEQVNFVRDHSEVVLLGTGFVEIDENSREIKKHLYPSAHHALVRRLESMRGFFPHSSAFYQTDEVRQVGGYNSHFRRAQDWRLWMELAVRGKIASLPKPLVRIRRHSGQISRADNGGRQFCDATTATVCHFLRRGGCKDPAASSSADEWIAFSSWVENRIKELGVAERRNAWTDGRDKYFATENKLTGAYRCIIRLWQSGQMSALVWEKLFGSSLPKRLAREWIVKHKAR